MNYKNLINFLINKLRNYYLTYLSKASFWISNEKIDNFFNEKKIFFIIGLGRSGTKLLTEILNQMDIAIVFHEPVLKDYKAIVRAHKSNIELMKYITNFRKKYIYLLLRNKNFQIYGEVNSNLRYHIKELKSIFPNAKFLHIVRDGRDVVRSIMARKHYTGDRIGHHNIIPKTSDPFYIKWKELTRFEKICWLWKDSNNYIGKYIQKFVNFETLINNYDYFQKNIEDYLDLKIGYNLWKKKIEKPANITIKHVLPPHKFWDQKLKDKFDYICEEEMRQYGYYK